MGKEISGKRIKVEGIVQGVGFRPFVHRLVKEFSLCGWVRNTNFGAEMELCGRPEELEAFVVSLKNNHPPLSMIESISEEEIIPAPNFEGFNIISSLGDETVNTLISPDICTCEDCRGELLDPENRRYRFPFINCTNCGPRFTIISELPYDRAKTSMSEFPMCEKCRAEFSDIEDRRYHAQPDCCFDCGPKLFFLSEKGEEVSGNDAIEIAREQLKDGKIIAVKGLGGMHLACGTGKKEADRLRSRKQRDEKPFALMCRDLDCAKKICKVSPKEEQVLCSERRPIVLLEKKDKNSFPHLSDNGSIGIMLPYTPLHFLLFGNDIESLIMTSANISDTPIVYKNDEALEKLEGIADGYLLHNREIKTRCDDSVLRIYDGNEYFLRRSRGYVPYPITVQRRGPEMLACGAEQKASFSLRKGKHIFQSQHIGDLKNIETLNCYSEQIAHFEQLFEINPRVIACDMHPDYLSSRYATEVANSKGLPLFEIQHHHAHLASCMADNEVSGNCLGLTWDGTGLGTDGSIWGGELLFGDCFRAERIGSIRPMLLPGGDKSAKSIWRIGLSMLADSGYSSGQLFDENDSNAVLAQLKNEVNCIKSSGMGRLFDGVMAILGKIKNCSYEGQGAILLEAAAAENEFGVYDSGLVYENEFEVFDWRAMVRQIVAERNMSVETGVIAARFMNTIINVAEQQCLSAAIKTGCTRVCLSGGVFQNMYVMKRLPERLRNHGFKVYNHRRVSTNDEGISLGQLMIAEAKYVSGSSS